MNNNKEVIVISGSSGLIGTALISRLAESYYRVGLDISCPALPPITAECISMDLTSEESIRRALARVRYGYGNRISSVVHLAAYYDFSGKPAPLYKKINVEGTALLLEALKEFEVEQFIFSSSLLVYKPVLPGTRITEDFPLEPKWDYPRSKVETEKNLFLKREKIPVLNLRIAGIYDDMCHSLPIANHIQRIYEKQLTSHFFPGDVTHGNPYLHMNDLTGAIVKAIEKRKVLPPEETINLGESETMSFIELQHAVSELLYDKKWKTFTIPKALAKAGAWVQNLFEDSFIKPWMISMADDHMELDISKAKKFLEWEPEHSLRATLPKMIQSLKSDPGKWYQANKLKK